MKISNELKTALNFAELQYRGFADLFRENIAFRESHSDKEPTEIELEEKQKMQEKIAQYDAVADAARDFSIVSEA